MKELEKTPFIIGLLKAAVGEDVDLDKLHVYEVRATSTIALRGKRGTIFEKAKISPNTIAQLARAVSEDPLPLMMDHDLRGSPYGKFFYGEAIPMDSGETELRGYMYVDESEPKILQKVNSATIDELSIQFSSEKMLCSECSFDYREAADNDNYMPFITLECDEGHKIGKDGVHINMVGLDEAIELSLVSRGAAKNSKIITPSDAKLAPEVQRLAAKGVELHNFYCTASIGDDQGVDELDIKEFTAALTAASNEKADLTAKLTTAEGQVTALTASVTEKDTQIATLTAQVADLDAEGDDPEISSEDLGKLKAFVGEQFVALKALDGDAAAVAPDKIEDMIKFVDESKARLSAIIPAGGAAVAAAGGAENAEAKAKAAEEDRLKATIDAYRSEQK